MAVLTNKYGTSNLSKVEDVVQETFLKAMRIWAYKELPENPTAWLFKVANNAMIDLLRRAKKIHYTDDPIRSDRATSATEMTTESEIADSQLKMIFACCHPSLSQEHQIILSLKLIGGFSNKELAEALLKKEETVAKSFTRAKKKFRDEVQFLQIPIQMGLQSRLFVVLRVIYLLFSEGYSNTTGSQVLKKDICYEALRLALLLFDNPYCQHRNLNALIALMCFHASRFDARLDEKGNMITLEFQNRSKYNKELIGYGIYYLKKAGNEKENLSNYHFEAAISLYHCSASSFETTDWASILQLYDNQLRRQESPMVALNRIVPLAKLHGPEKALEDLSILAEKYDYSKVGLFYAIETELLFNIGIDHKKSLEKATSLTKNELMRQNLIARFA